jgi:hypothetical protein
MRGIEAAKRRTWPAYSAVEPPSRSRFRQVKKPHADAARLSNGNQKPQFREAGLALPAITP